MEHLPLGVKDEEGCFVYQVCVGEGNSIAVRRVPKVGDETKTGIAFRDGDLVSIDLVRPSRRPGNKNGPFLRLSDCSGWLFEEKYEETMMTKIPVSVGLWCFVVDNCPVGIGLRRHPIDRIDMHMDDVTYPPMQKIHCDRKVQHPSTGINFYRVQGTEGWVFDRRPSSKNGYMLLDESMVQTGDFIYECIDKKGIGIRETPEVGDNNRTDLSLEQGDLISANVIRKSPFPHGNGPFLRLSDGSGWLFENKYNEQLMKRLSVRKGYWELKVTNPPGLALRRQPRDELTLRMDTEYPAGTIVRCTHMTQASSGVKFYRVKGIDGWVFDKREGEPMLVLLSGQSSPRNELNFSNEGSSSNRWSPDFVRGIAATVTGIREISLNEQSRVISFASAESDDVRINVYYTTRTIGTALAHPYQGATQLFRRNCTTEELKNIFENPRAHTGKGYKRRRSDPFALAPSEYIQTPYGQGLLADQESELRNELLELDEEIDSMITKRKRVLKRIRDADLERAEEANEMKLKMDERAHEQSERERVVQVRIAEEQRVAQARRAEEQRRAQQLRNRTCQVCNRVFQNWNAKQQHYDAVHVFRCDVCYKEFDSSYSLTQHRNALHHW